MAEDFVERLAAGPSVLFLGQAYMRLDTDVDPLLAAIGRKYAGASEGFSYQRFLDVESFSSDRVTAFAWVAARADAVDVPPWLGVAAKWRWNAVYSSAIDTAWVRAMRTPWRHVQPVLNHKTGGAGERSQTRLHCNALFGSLSATDSDLVAPCSRAEYRRRLMLAEAMAVQLPDLVTPFGTLAIEGYDSLSDWYTAERLGALLDMFGIGQVHIFSCARLPFVLPADARAISDAKVVLHDESLASVLHTAFRDGLLRPESYTDDPASQYRVNFGNHPVAVPTALWNEVTQSAEILTITPEPGPLSREATREEYRAFLGAGDVPPAWEWYARGFPLRRDFEDELEKRVSMALTNRKTNPRPIILHGQTSTGKTVALNSLAFRLSRDGRCPVLLIRGGVRNPDAAALVRFCEWAEVAGASETVVIWDGMQRTDAYSQLAAQLANQGRRALIVGSYYYIDEPKRRRGIAYIEAPADLAPSEARHLQALLSRFLSAGTDALGGPERGWDCLSALYRLLPPARPRIRSGVVGEVGISEDELRHRLGSLGIEDRPGIQVADALLRAGLLSPADFERRAEAEEPETVDEVGLAHKLIGFIMVPGQYRLRLPLDLLLRAVGGSAFQKLPAILDDLDIFRWYDDPPGSGNYLIGPRTSTEATLYVRTRLGSAASEVDCAVELLTRIRSGGLSRDGGEIEFAVALFHEMGPNGSAPDRYAPHFLRLADAAAVLGRAQGAENPRLLLQEATLRREWVKEFTDRGSPEDKNSALESAREALALASVAARHRNRALRVSIEVESGALHGAWYKELRKVGQPGVVLGQKINALLEHVGRARAMDPTSYYPVDVLAWAAIDALPTGVLPPAQAGELLAHVLGAFDSIELNALPAGQAEQCAKRSVEVASFLGRKEWLQRSLAALEQMGSAAGVYLIARQLMGRLPSKYPLDSAQLAAVREARLYLEEHSSVWSLDARCMFLHLKLWWLENVGVPWFHEERMVVPLRKDGWAECYGLLERLERIQTADKAAEASPTVQFLMGVALFHLGAYIQGADRFDVLANERDIVLGVHRIVRYYVLGLPSGEPAVFDGTVARVLTDGRKGLVELRGVPRAITFFVNDFGQDRRPGDMLSDVIIAFNHLGAIAEPSYRYRPNAERDGQSRRTS